MSYNPLEIETSARKLAEALIMERSPRYVDFFRPNHTPEGYAVRVVAELVPDELVTPLVYNEEAITNE